MIIATPFDPSLTGPLEKAIRAAHLGLNPANDGKVVLVPVPSLTEERRKELSRHVHGLAEEARNSVRQVRRDAIERLKKPLKSGAVRVGRSPRADPRLGCASAGAPSTPVVTSVTTGATSMPSNHALPVVVPP